MRKNLLFLLVLVSFLGSGCIGYEETHDEAASFPTQAAVQKTPTVQIEVKPTQEAESGAGHAVITQKDWVSECTLVSSSTETSPEHADIFIVSEDDWVVGPEDAAVTLIEYGDFQ